MKETQTLSYSLLVQLYEEVKTLEEQTMNILLKMNGRTKDFETQSNFLIRTSSIKYMIEDKLFIIWKEENKND